MKEILKCEDTGRPIVITVVLRGSAEPAWSVFARVRHGPHPSDRDVCPGGGSLGEGGAV